MKVCDTCGGRMVIARRIVEKTLVNRNGKSTWKITKTIPYWSCPTCSTAKGG